MIALVEHSFIWSFLVCLPILTYIGITNNWELASAYFIYCVVLNTLIHAEIDDEKANNKNLGLIGDQFLHFAQIFTT